MSLFQKEDLPRSVPKVLMHVIDAGCGTVCLECPKCKHEVDVEDCKYSITEFKKGIPCPKCNSTSKAGDMFKESMRTREIKRWRNKDVDSNM